MVKLDILSDPICPWCYIGKANLDRALSQRPDHELAIEWHPFQLNPDMPDEGMDRRTYLETKFGGKERAVTVYAQIEQAAKVAGLDVDFGAIKRTPNTINAHRLIHWAGVEGRQLELGKRFAPPMRDQAPASDRTCQLSTPQPDNPHGLRRGEVPVRLGPFGRQLEAAPSDAFVDNRTSTGKASAHARLPSVLAITLSHVII